MSPCNLAALERVVTNHRLRFVCLLGNLFSIPEKSNSFLRWLQSLAAYSRNTRKRDFYHPWLVSNIVKTQFTKEKGGCSRNKFL